MTIKLLEEQLINKIAAGEVIERPASVVKELVENSIDAGSSRIIVNIAGGGVDRIEVEDNGQGIAMQDVTQALLRHATSKITNESDLFTINTMGFRGEALPSIASISRMELYTQQETDSGCHVQVEGGIVRVILPFFGSTGTRILIEELFYNTPVRKNFLKSVVSEQAHIFDIMSKLALSRPDISFSLSSEKKLYFKTPGNGNLRDTLIAINGRDFADQFIDLKITGGKYTAYGLVSKADFHRVNRKNQIFYVNNRLIKSPMLARAVDEGYKGLLLAREYPGVIIFLEVDHADVDINVHPQKTEVRFRDESSIFRMLSRGINDTVNGLVFPMGAAGLSSIDSKQSGNNPLWNNDYRTIAQPTRQPAGVQEQNIPFTHASTDVRMNSLEEWTVSINADNKELFRVLGQCFNSYILVELEGRLWLVDQHAAHERIMYTRYKEKSNLDLPELQILAVPLAIEVSAAEMDLIEQNTELFTEMGISLEALGPDTIVIRSTPPSIQGQESELITEMLEMIGDKQTANYQEKALCMMACKQAVKAGQTLNRTEMEQLMRDLFEVEDYMHCPHGRPTFIEITHSELDRRFKR